MSPFLHSLVLAAAQTAEEQQPESWTQQNPMATLALMIGFVLIMYWLLLGKPQQQQRKKRDQMLGGMRKGDKVVTIGGIHGKITRVDKDNGIITVQVAKGVEVDFTQSAISSIAHQKGEGGESKGG